MKWIVCASIAFAALALTAKPAQAMPIFAKTYQVNCNTCHTMVPALNSYGRYVQRTGYSSLDPHVLARYTPIWIGEQLNGDSTGGVSDIKDSYKNSFGNIALHAAGYVANDWTYHVQQWLLANDSGGGGLDTAWVAYNNLFHRDGHLFVGKVEAPGPSSFSQWMDVTEPVTQDLTIGEHSYVFDANRWGAKLAYTPGSFDAELAWLGSGNDLPSGLDFDVLPGTEKTLQWKLAYGPADRPLEVGAYGAFGTFIVSTGAVDHYNAFAPYVERDPQGAVPGVLAYYQFAHDSNPGLDPNGLQLPAANGRGLNLELYESLFHGNAMLSAREDVTDDGLGNVLHYQAVDLAFGLPHYPYLHAYLEAGLNANSTTPNGTPTWRWVLWWTTPIAQ